MHPGLRASDALPVYGRNPDLRGPMGQPSEIIRTADLAGMFVEVPHHSWGHVFRRPTDG